MMGPVFTDDFAEALFVDRCKRIEGRLQHLATRESWLESQTQKHLSAYGKARARPRIKRGDY